MRDSVLQLPISIGPNSKHLTSLLYGHGTPNIPQTELEQFNSGLPVATFAQLRESWLSSALRQGHAETTREAKRRYSNDLLQFLYARHYDVVGQYELESFIDHLQIGHLEKNGRFGSAATNLRARTPLRPITIHTRFQYLKGLWTWLQKHGHISDNPFDRMDAPTFNADQKQPFTPNQIQSLMAAAKSSACPQRNQAMVAFLLDTGVRASEFCSIKLGDVDFSDEQTLRVKVLGKGNKFRILRLSPTASGLMWNYFKNEHGLERFYKNRNAAKRRTIDTHTPLFISAHRANVGQALHRNGLRFAIRDLGAAAKIGAVQCSPHTFRHTFAITFIRAGGDVFTLRDMLGHSTLAIVQQYLAISQADIENQHARFSPAETILGKR